MSLYKTNIIIAVASSFLSLTSLAQTNTPIKFKNSEVYAGIEVGSKGVKMSIIEMGKNAPVTGLFNTIRDTSVNTDFISFTPQTFSATLKGLSGLYNTAATQYNIPSERIYTVVSSGVKGQADKDNKLSWIQDLADSFRIAVKEPKRELAVIDVLQEARLSHLGIVPESRRYNTFLIDIGSGNTKGGYFKNGNTKDLRLFQLTWGTKTIANATDKRTEEDRSITNYRRQLVRVLAGEPEQEIVFAVNESGAYNMNDNFAFSGGIAWSVATLLSPELNENSVVPFTYADLVKFNDRLANEFASLSADAVAASVTDKAVDKTSVKAEVNKVHKVFDRRSLMAGTALLLNIVRQFEGTWEKKHFYLVKNGQVGWISAYVNQSVKN